MSYQIKSIWAENLFSWETLAIDFEENSVYSLVGENGAGKSSIFEIITWVLFKKTTKKHVGADYGKKEGVGEIHFHNGVVVRRETKAPTFIHIGNEVIEQEDLDRMLNCNYETFMASITCNQRRVASFINEKSDSGKAKIFGAILGIDVLDDVRSKVSKIKNERELEFVQLQAQYNSLTEQIETAKLKFGDLTPQQFRECIVEDKAELEVVVKENEELAVKSNKVGVELKAWNEYENAVERTKKLTGRYKEAVRCAKFALDRLKEVKIDETNTMEEVENSYYQVMEEVAKLDFSCSSAETYLNKLMKIVEMKGLCPTCRQNLSISARTELQTQAWKEKDQVEILRKEYAEKRSQLSKLKKEMEVKKLHKDIKDEFRSYKKQVDELKEELKAQPQKPSFPKPDWEAIRLDVERGLSKAASLREGIKGRVSLLKSYSEAITKRKEVAAGYKKSEKEHTAAKWLFQALPTIKLMYINENKTVLEGMINENINMMNLDFRVKIETEKELKSTKEIRDEFSFQIISTKKDLKVDKADLSGGEETMILLATQWAICDMFQPSIEFEIIDEAFGSLDDKHIEIAVDALKDRGLKKQLFVISHKPEIAQSFDHIVQIKKGENGSYVA